MQSSNKVQASRSLPVLRNGSRGDEVTLLQDYLNNYNFSVATDGFFGQRTEVAVKGFQGQEQLPVDGIVGTETWNALLSGYYPPVARPILLPGSTGNDVAFLQQRLRTLGYTLTVDGVFGSNTEAAVKDFQGNRGIPMHGIADPKTWNAVLS